MQKKVQLEGFEEFGKTTSFESLNRIIQFIQVKEKKKLKTNQFKNAKTRYIEELSQVPIDLDNQSN